MRFRFQTIDFKYRLNTAATHLNIHIFQRPRAIALCRQIYYSSQTGQLRRAVGYLDSCYSFCHNLQTQFCSIVFHFSCFCLAQHFSFGFLEHSLRPNSIVALACLAASRRHAEVTQPTNVTAVRPNASGDTGLHANAERIMNIPATRLYSHGMNRGE